MTNPAPFTLIFTDAGRAALLNAEQTGTERRTIVRAELTNVPFEMSPSLTGINDIVKTITTVAGAASAPDQLSIAILDTSADLYEVSGFGLFLDDGTLLAVYSQDRPFISKTDFSMGHIQVDCSIRDASINAENIQFGDFSFNNPIASIKLDGVIKLATVSQGKALAEKGAYAITPYVLGQTLEDLKATTNDWVNGTPGKYVTVDVLKNANIGNVVGDIQLMPFRANALPKGWKHANGDKFSTTTSDIGKALKALPSAYKTDWGIVESSGMINLPNMYHEDGRAYFQRAGTTPGVIQQDAIRNFTGRMVTGSSEGSGVFETVGTRGNTIFGGNNATEVTFDPSRVVPTAEENRPLNIAFTPAIYLGV